jgi:hypothetical protein
VPGVGENDGPAIGVRWNAIKRSAGVEEWVEHLEHQDTAQSQVSVNRRERVSLIVGRQQQLERAARRNRKPEPRWQGEVAQSPARTG